MYAGFLMGKKLRGKAPLEDLGVDGRDERYLPSDRHNHIKLVVVRQQNSRLQLVANLHVSCLPAVDGKKTRAVLVHKCIVPTTHEVITNDISDKHSIRGARFRAAIACIAAV